MLERITMPPQLKKILGDDGISHTQLAEMKANVYNERQGDLGEFDCPICRNKGYVAFVSDDVVKTRECECAAKRRSLKRIRQSGLKDLLATYTFDSFETPKAWMKTAKRTAMDYLTKDDGWFVITGTPGTGKTHLCTAICGELINAGKEVRYMLWREEAPRLKAMVNDREEYEHRMNGYKKVDVLYIDDFLKGNVTEADINLAFELLNSRYNTKRLQTVISSEKTIEQMLDIDEAIGSRIYERSKGSAIKTPAENWRLR